jgi:acyl carrier protein
LSFEQRVTATVSRATDIPIEQIDSSSGIGITSGWDSFGHLRVILELEAEFSVRFEMERIPELKSVKLIEQELRTLGAS